MPFQRNRFSPYSTKYKENLVPLGVTKIRNWNLKGKPIEDNHHP
jgi:hypothetical protein